MMTQEFRLPDLGEGIHEAEILEVCVAAGQAVREGESILQVETDKAVVEVPSPCTGTVAEIKVNQGDLVRVGEVLMTFTTGEVEKKALQQPAQAVQPAEQPRRGVTVSQTNGHPVRHPVPASPATRRLAMEFDVDLHAVPGIGPGGRVTAEDVRAFAGKAAQAVSPIAGRDLGAGLGPAPGQVQHEAAPTETPEEQAAAPGPERPLVTEVPPLPDFSRWGPVQQVPLQSVRRVTARQMSLTVLVLRAVVAVLKQFPRFNASLDAEGGQLILKQYYHIGMAMDTERGLIVPVMRDVDRKSIIELAIELTALVEQVRHGKVNRDDFQGGTFTITNPGAIGGTTFTPIINYPEVAILGLGRTRLEPVVQGDLDNFTITPKLCLPLHLAFDHRVNDGADAARFMRALIDTLRDPEVFLLRG